ncbi:MAG TPA: thiamine pyrophosphate-dependent enzyme [Bacteroidales bacterium]|nr:indolepyruvate ferredoxin oxidoreductase [Bacteroidales bacterium]HNZ43343.1 thiamine pyrophosphate-dependent enzyme [Bacteroidales bacterium]HPB25987.1 thiamine pyrophosphate-dependent enzyme [Bacteroidales bacterium]HPI30513.1 thiamine pyrophosphate-dependent enzyme [Bacteroidales bacterium]HQN16621.1 thiamine pyrophosphate-dependent enzyme [Bacteroidales bacterium]
MQKLMLLGDEAIAQGAIDAGISGVYAYPGTPSTEITEYIEHSREAKEKNIKANWAANEKTAVEGAIGMAYAGKRVITCMKHVGMNVAADAFVNSAITGTNGGMIVVAADDPSMHSSQNEQDSRFYGRFSMLPILEPTNQQEAYDMAHYGFELSEKYHLPVLMRITTRLAHSRSGVVRKPARAQNELKLPEDMKQYVLLPAIARKRYKLLLSNQEKLVQESEQSPFNKYVDGQDKSKGIITFGIAYNYLLENYPDRVVPYPVVKISQYPAPFKAIEKLCSECKEVMVFEEGAPMMEEWLRGYLDNNLKIKGRMDGTLPRDGELTPNIVAAALGIKVNETMPVPEIVVGRPPSLCTGCPHADTYLGLNEAIAKYGKGRVFSDIGCYTLGALPPFNAINSCVDMGASITMAKGAADAGLVPAVAVIGDSTFTHSGMTGLLDAINDNAPITVVILDNSITAMTGGQKSAATGKVEKIVKGLGADPEHVHIIKPLKKNHEENVKIFEKELAYQGLSVIIPTRECIVSLNKRMREKFKEKKEEKV